MPEQKSQRGQPLTTAQFDNQPWETTMTPLGLKGVNLTQDLEALDPGEYQVLTNAYHRQDFSLTSRPGLGTPVFTTGGSDVHTAVRLNDPLHGTFVRIAGVDDSVYLGASGALASIDSGYSGDPLCVLPSHPTLGNGTWAIVADRNRVRQMRTDGLVLPLGLPAPSVAAVPTLQAIDKVSVLTFTTADGSGHTAWGEQLGADFSAPPIPTLTPLANDAGGIGVEFVTVPGAAVEDAAKGYWSYWWHGFGAGTDLSTLGSSTKVDDQDFLHLAIKLSHPQLTAELRIYFVCSAVFDPTFVPGFDGDHNIDFFVHTFPQNDYSAYLQSQATLASAAAAAANNATSAVQAQFTATSLSDALQRAAAAHAAGLPTLFPSDIVIGARAPEVPILSPASGGLQLPSGSTWVDYGVIGRPLRRIDFTRFGNTEGRDWSTITGVIVYVQTTEGTGGPVAVALSDAYFYGGVGIDSADPGDQPYDWRYTHYDTRSGDEGNPSPTMDPDTTFLDSARTKVSVVPVAYGDAGVRQRFYRRGGTLVDDWFFEGANEADGGAFLSFDSDEGLSAAGTVQLDHYEAIPSVDALGGTILHQPVAQLFGPYNGILFAVRDPNRPGYVAWCLPDAPGHWPATYNAEVCPAAEELMAGCIHAGQPYVFSRERGHVLYPSFGQDVTVTAAPTSCRRGIWATTGLLVSTRGIVGVAKDGVFLTAGGGPEKLISGNIESLFLGKTVNGYLPIDKGVPEAVRLTELADEVYFQYQDTGGNRQIWVYAWKGEYWRHYHFTGGGSALALDEGNPVPALLMGGVADGQGFLFDGTAMADNTTAIAVTAHTRADDYGKPRENKLLGDQILEADRAGVEITLQNFLNGEQVANAAMTLSEGTGRTWAIADAFGVGPQLARTISTLITWASAFYRPILYKLGVSIQPQPELTINRVTQWDDLGHPDEKYLTGVTFDCDTGGADRTILIEADLLGAITTIATLTVNHAGRHKVGYSWAGANANLVRVRPTGECVGWLLYRADWLFVPEPPRVAGWDVYFENASDQYYTGLDLFCHTYGATKTIQVYVDNALISTQSVTTVARKLVHLTLPWGRGHVFRFVATDTHLGTLFSHKWYLHEEPTELTNLDEVFTVAGTLSDKLLKGVVLEIDTFGVNKTVVIDIDGSASAVTLPVVNTNGRLVVPFSFPQVRGRVFRLFSYDTVPCRKYSSQWLFDEEPFGLTRWESQETDDGVPGYKTWMFANVTLLSAATVVMTMVIQRSQSGDGQRETLTYAIPSTAGVKLDMYVPFAAAKGVKVKYLFESAAAFTLYREESSVVLLPWGQGQTLVAHPFGDDDTTRPTRDMVNSGLAAARGGGS